MAIRLDFRVWLASIAFVFTVNVNAQLKPNPAQQPPANAWMKTVSPYIDPASTANDSIRVARDRFWDDSPIASRVRLTPALACCTAISDGSFGPNKPEIPAVRNRHILVGTFTAFRSILTASGRCVYTDVSFRVGHVMEGAGLEAGQTITVSLHGGTVMDSNGQVISYLTQSHELFIQPARTYLMVLSFQPAGNFFTLVDDWDLTDGTATPNSIFNRSVSRDGRSVIAGKSEDQIAETLRKRQEILAAPE